jgi:hypothetical protein
MSGLYLYPGLLPGSYPCQCGNNGVVLVDGDAEAVCSKCSTGSEALIRMLGYVKLPNPLRSVRTADQQGAVGGIDRRPRGGPVLVSEPPRPDGPGGRDLRL